MGHRKLQKQSKLRTFLIRYSVVFVVTEALLVIACFLLYLVSMPLNILVPSPPSAQYREYVCTLVKSTDLRNGLVIPGEPNYTVFSTQGQYLYGNLDERIATVALFEYKQSSFGNVADISSQYLVIEKDDDYIIIDFGYPKKQMFADYTLRNLFPVAETAYYILFAILSAAFVTFNTYRGGNSIFKQMQLLINVSKQISDQELDFDMPISEFVELNQVLDAMDKMRNSLKETLLQYWTDEKRRNEQIAALAHDIKTPLTVVQGNAELLLERECNAEQKVYIEYVVKNADILSQHLARLREVVHTGMTELSFVPTGLMELWCELKRLLEAMLVNKGLHIKTAETIIERKTVYRILADAQLLTRAFLNVFENAVQHTPPAGTITFTIDISKSAVRFSVEDGGSGFSSSCIASNDNPIDFSDPILAGHGLGIQIARSVIAAHQGTFRMTNSSKALGGSVTIELPLVVSTE